MVAKLKELVSLLESLKQKPEVKKTSTFYDLQKSKFVNEYGEPNADGLKFIDNYEALAKKYGKDSLLLSIENRPGWEGSLFSYGIKIKPNAKEKTKATSTGQQKSIDAKIQISEAPTASKKESTNPATIYQAPETPKKPLSDSKFEQSLQYLKFFEGLNLQKDNSIIIDTKIPFRRTVPEVKKLEEFANQAQVSFKAGSVVYSLGDNVKIIAKDTGYKNKRVKKEKKTGDKKGPEENLTITIMPGSDDQNKTAKEFVKKFLQDFKPYNPLA